MIDERLERVDDLAGVAKIVVEDQRYERHWRRAVPVEDTLTFVGEDIQATGFVVLQGREKRVPPCVGEVLGLDLGYGRRMDFAPPLLAVPDHTELTCNG